MVAGIGAILSPLYGFYNTIFGPVLALGPYPSLAFFSMCLAGLFAVLYYIFLDIEKADRIKDKLNKHQEKMKEAQKDEESDKVSNHLQKTMELNQKFMMLNLKPMLATMVFVSLIFPWLGATYAPTVDMNRTANDTWTGQLKFNGHSAELRVVNNTTPVVKIDGQTADISRKEKFDALGVAWQTTGFNVNSGDARLHVNGAFIPLPFSLPFIGGTLNWLGFYIVIAMPLSYILRKMLGVA
ncbi:MAG: EMC3/TMCO1 family protein [Candidatus Nanohaloarchaea archaeon]